jgi:hypothetical protein
MILIGLVGKKRAGKDTACEFMSTLLHPKITRRVGFADELKKEICVAINGVNSLYGTPMKQPMTPNFIDCNKDNFRLILQGWGTDFRRNMCNDNYWIDKTLKTLVDMKATVDCAIIPDVRFRNEAKMIKTVGGHLIRIFRPNMSSKIIDSHASETELDSIDTDWIVNNDSSFEVLREKLLKILKEIGLKK